MNVNGHRAGEALPSQKTKQGATYAGGTVAPKAYAKYAKTCSGTHFKPEHAMRF